MVRKDEKSSKRIELSNDYMFATIMGQERELCRRVLETILGFEIESLVYLDEQMHLKSDVESHGIRLDVVAKNTGAVYDIEMQKVRMGDIPRRARYYQSQIDVSELDKGIEYGELKDSYVIFICGFDLFDMGEYVYRFENYDIEKRLPLDDGTKKIVINTKGTKGDISTELREFITYIDKPQEIGKSLTTDLVKQLEMKVIDKNKDRNWREDVMRMEADRADLIGIGRQEGLSVGLTRGRKEGEQKGLEIASKIFRLFRDGKSEGQIASAVGLDVATVRRVLG